MTAPQTLPSSERRDWLSHAWLLPSWLLSLLVHAGLLFLVAAVLSGWRQEPVGFTNEPSRELGIVLKSAGVNPDPSAAPNDSESLDPSPVADDVPSPEPVAEPTTATPMTPQAAPTTETPLPAIGAGALFPSTVQADPRELIQSGGPKSTGEALSGAMPGAAFMGAQDNGTRVVFVIDCSASMANYGAMLSAKAALVSSLQTLADTQQFQIIFYNQTPRLMSVRGRTYGELMFATEVNKALARQFIGGIEPGLGTDHMPALKMGLRMTPEVLFFLTDADQPTLSAGELNELQRLNQGRTRIHTIEFGVDASLQVDNFLTKLARQNGGTYRYFDVKRLHRP